MVGRVNGFGLVIAGVGFLLTRFTVTLALYEDPAQFYLAGIVPLMLGLGLAAFGVALTVADVRPAVVRTTAIWCVIGAGTMLVLVVLTLLGSAGGGLPGLDAIRSQVYLSNFLIGGSIGGTLTGLYASRNRRQRVELERQANRLEVLNRLLRHEVLNAVSVIRGYASSNAETDPGSSAIITDHADTIQRAVEDVKYLTRSAGTDSTPHPGIDLADALEASLSDIRERYPAADVSVDSPDERLTVGADGQLEQVFTHLLENAVEYATADDPEVSVAVSATAADVRVGVTDRGPGLPGSQQELLETGRITEFDDPGTGFGLNVVRLLVESYGGEIETAVGDGETTITVVLPRASSPETGFAPARSGLGVVRPSFPHLVVTLGAAVIAGVFYGIVSESLGGSIAGIGVFYGTASPVVGWITHEFHSVVFGFVYTGLVSVAPARLRRGLLGHLAIGLGWSVVLWVVAAGIIAPIWLQLLGIPASIPNLSAVLLASHAVWGLALAILTWWGSRVVAPRIPRLDRPQ